jgi:signal transduction histidine kinase
MVQFQKWRHQPLDQLTPGAKSKTGMNQPKNETGLSPTSATGKGMLWLGRWLQPSGPRAVVMGVVILALIIVMSSVVYETGGTRFAWLHLMYLPIILAAACFGVYGGIVAALLAGFALGPHMPMNVATGLPQTTSNWLFRIGFFLLVGLFSGLISNFLNGQIKRLRQTNQQLLQAHEELKSAQMKLIQTAKLESIGRLAAGLAHEVKNPLAVIQLGVDYLTSTTKADASRDTVETVQEMADAVQRADTVIKGLLNFSRAEKLALVPMDLNSVIEESLVLVRHEFIKHNIVLEKNLAAGLPQIGLDQGKIKQVFINMFMNAIQAMGGDGKLSVSTFRPPAGIKTAGESTGGESVVVQIDDTGGGIPEDKLDKLFEPFFTTKPVGSGTGLGLSVSKNIVELHGGTIMIRNRTDARGAAVTITFPIPTKG